MSTPRQAGPGGTENSGTDSDLRNLLSSIKLPILRLDVDLSIRSFTPSAAQAFGLRDVDLGRSIAEIADRLEHPSLLDDLQQVIRSQADLEREVNGVSERNYIMRILPYCSMEGRTDGLVLTFTDITERRRKEEQQKLLLAELSHRVKNTLATVQSIAAQTLRRSDSFEAFYQSFSRRLRALANAHSLLTAGDWHSASLRNVVAEPLTPYQTTGDRVRFEGPDLELKPGAALALSLIVHELTTNAAKHGALSSPTGRVRFEWDLTGTGSDRALRFRWRETGGPGAAPPAEHGFGLVLIERSIGHELDGEVRFDFTPEGLCCEFLVPYTARNFRL